MSQPRAGVSSRPDVSRCGTICAALAWYDEPVEFLDRCVRSLAGFADYLVALDGPWRLMPHDEDRPWSDAAQARVIVEAARAARLPYRLGAQPSDRWGSQVEKRAELMREASQHGDWTFVIDADEHVHEAHADAVRAILAETPTDVATVLCHVTTGATAADRYRAPIRRMYRNPVTVEEGHNGYRTPDGRWLHGDPTYVQLEPAATTPLELHHQFRDRGPERNQAAAAYRAARRADKPGGWL